MSKKIVVVTRKLPGAVQARLARDYEPRFNADDRVYSSDELVALAEGAAALLPCHSERIDAATIARLPDSVVAIANFSVGVDHVDLDAARERGIVVTNTPDVLSDATAEIAVLLMLGAARRASEGDRLVRSGGWTSWSPAFMVGTQVTGKRLGIVGMGRVGQVVARRARGFDMEIHYHNRRRLPAEAEQGAVYHERLDDLLGAVDVLSLHCPAGPETRGLLGRERLARLGEGAVVVNTARGALVDDDALIDALQHGRVAAAGLDVFNGEPDIHPGYRALDNVFLLPHIGSATRETRDAMGFRALDNLDAIFAGREPRDRVA
ncbi:MAG: D-glycerate dehydrogenase [Gammaproteobacteria bacterium]|nr:D-glycerate dehydrogenase [Gammaproteobacteria bacterium]